MNKAINKPITMVIKDTKEKLASVCNQSGLSPAILDLIIQGIYSEVRSLAEQQALEEERVYLEMIANDNAVEGECDETK